MMHSGGICKKCTPSCIAAVLKISPGDIFGECFYIWMVFKEALRVGINKFNHFLFLLSGKKFSPALGVSLNTIQNRY